MRTLRTIVFNVRIDGRTYSFNSGVGALDFLMAAARTITQKPWENGLPELGIVLDIKELEEPKPEEDLHCDEELEKECEGYTNEKPDK